jgi:hypothetical protein
MCKLVSLQFEVFKQCKYHKTQVYIVNDLLHGMRENYDNVGLNIA